MASTVRLKLPLSAPRPSGDLGVAADVLGPGLEVLPHEVAVEGLVARGHRGVGGEDRVQGEVGQRVGQAVAAAHPLARALQAEEGHVAFVHVADRRPDVQGAQRAHAADAEHDLLAQPHLAPAHVEHGR